jgi:toluene monooxygenase electron transfer component
LDRAPSTTRIAIDGSDQSFECEHGDTVMRAALRAGIPFPYECNVGKCGSCRFELIDGQMGTLWEEAPALTARDRSLNKRLGCQSAPTSDCTVKVRLDRNCQPDTRPALRRATLVETRNVTHDIREFTFRCDGPVKFRAGQYALLHLPGVEGPRAYSMSNLPNDEGLLTFLIKFVKGGKGTQVLFEKLRPGDTVTVDLPYGLAFFREQFDRDIVCIAGGSGISPIISIVRQAARHPDFENRRIHVFYGGRGPSDICGDEFLRLLPRFGQNITFSASISVPGLDPNGMWVGPVGFVHEQVERVMDARLPQCEHYLAGPPPMLQAAVQMLVLRHKVSLDRVHFDRFF